MSWKDIKTQGIPRDPIIQECRQISKIIIDLLRKNLFLQDKFKVFQLNISYFLKRMYTEYNITPNQILFILSKRPDLLRAIHKNKFRTIKKVLLSKDQDLEEKLNNNEENKERTFVTLFYDRYAFYKSFFRAVLQTRKYPFEHFTRSFIKNIFNKYPFLRNQSHLKHVINLLKQLDSAYYLTQFGIKEKYDYANIISKMDN